MTSAGQVTAPFPERNILGSRDGELRFYVVSHTAPPLAIAPLPRIAQPADGPITFTLTPPAGLTGVEMETTTTMPGFILEETRGPSLTYEYDVRELAKEFPNLDLYDQRDAFGGGDTITMSFFVTGTDARGIRRHFARQVVLQGEELQVTEQKETITPPRHRSVRQ